tara:strand:- start:2498 stop:2722 length:225 start_codon:yes stop_codon:yes gene_type:complete
MEPKTQREHIIALNGHITGVKRDMKNIKDNHLKHMQSEINRLGGKVDKIYWAGLTTVGAVSLIFIEAVLNRIGM